MELEKIIEYIVQEVIKKINSQNLIEDCSPKALPYPDLKLIHYNTAHCF